MRNLSCETPRVDSAASSVFRRVPHVPILRVCLGLLRSVFAEDGLDYRGGAAVHVTLLDVNFFFG